MNIDHLLSKRTYFQTLVGKESTEDAIKDLGLLFLEENTKEIADLSYIRYAQGEVYFHYKDYEAAIFKWENINNELEAWAKKNVGDAYLELNLLAMAISTYKGIETENQLLQTEIALKLFEIYVQENNQPLAVQYIKQAVCLFPDYPNLTKTARAFFEQSRDYDHAIELAVNEAIRTEDVRWFDILTEYVEKGYARTQSPSYFNSLLEVLYVVDNVRFEKLVAAFWDSYSKTNDYLPWVEVIDCLLETLDVEKSTAWNKISKLYNDTLLEVLNGGMELKALIDFMPKFLSNFTRITKPSESLIAYSSTLAWNEFYPSSINEEVLEMAHYNLSACKGNATILEESLQLFQSISKWANANAVEVKGKLRWFVQEILDLTNQNILLVGVNGTGKSSFLNSILGEMLFEKETNNMIRIKNGVVPQITTISDEEIFSETVVPDLNQLINHDLNASPKSITDISIPNEVLSKYNISFIDTPGFRARRDGLEVTEFLPLADELMFILDAEDPFTVQERDILLQILESDPTISVTFILTKLDTIYNKQEAKKLVEDVTARIQQYIPGATVIAFSSKYEIAGQYNEITELLAAFNQRGQRESKRAHMLQQVIQRLITQLLKSRVEKENTYHEDIQWNEELLEKLNASIKHIQDYEDEKSASIVRKYHEIKKEIKEEMEIRIPQILRGCSGLIKEDSDFRKIHLELNDEMNKKLQQYVEDNILPQMYASLNSWLASCNEEFLDSKAFLEEMSARFNEIYGEEVVQLQGDFKILEDWARDINRMTSSVRVDRENILLRHTTSQFLFKSAGKIFGAISQNKTLFNQYKKFIDNENYEETTNSVISKFFMQFELFEKALERDMALFFKQPIQDLKTNVQIAHTEIENKEELLMEMKTKPEIYFDAITLFKIRLRQQEIMNMVK